MTHRYGEKNQRIIDTPVIEDGCVKRGPMEPDEMEIRVRVETKLKDEELFINDELKALMRR